MVEDDVPYLPMPQNGAYPEHSVCGPCPGCNNEYDHCPQAMGGPDDNDPVTRGTRVNG